MTTPILATKLYIPLPRLDIVPRPRLIEKLHKGASRKLTLIAAPAGFGKSTLLSTWVKQVDASKRVAWLSLDEGDNDLARFLRYLIAALQTVEPNAGQEASIALQSQGAIDTEVVLTSLLNEITEIPEEIVLILEDYHVIESQPIDQALTFLLDHLPVHMHLAIASRINPSLPISRLRALGQMTEVRADDLRFTLDEASIFLSQAASINLSKQDIASLETHTEGWIAGLQLAALSMQDLESSSEILEFISNFTGSNRHIQDYLADEVLQKQPLEIKDFLLKTSILNRLSAPLCDAVRVDGESRVILELLEASNLFIVPLDSDRQWYRYHHLFADLLRQRLRQEHPDLVTNLHIRASKWHEDNDLEIDAFRHAVAANDIDRASRLIEGNQLPTHIHSVVTQIINWLESLPSKVMNERPLLLIKHATLLLAAGQTDGVETKLQAAETVLLGTKSDEKTRDLLGQIAVHRATLASALHQIESMIEQSQRALEFLHINNLEFRGATRRHLGYAHLMQGDRSAALEAYTEAVEITKSGNRMSHILANIGLGMVQEADIQLNAASDSYHQGLQLFGDLPQPIASQAYIGLARISYERNDLEAAQNHGLQGSKLAKQFGSSVDRAVVCDLILTRIQFAQGDTARAMENLQQIEQSVRQHNFKVQEPKVAAMKIQFLLHQGDLKAAAHLASKHELPISQARVHQAQGEISTTLSILDSVHAEMEAKDWKDEILKIGIFQAVALYTQGDIEKASQYLEKALVMAEPGGFIRTFVEEGDPMAKLLHEAAGRGIMPEYMRKLLAAFEPGKRGKTGLHSQPLIDPLSQREMEVLQLVAQGHTNREICDQLFVALDTVKGHNNRIYSKLGVKNRTQAVNKAISLKIIPPQQS